MNYENSKISDLQRLLIDPSDKINLKRNDKYVALSSHTKTSGPTLNDKFELSDGTAELIPYHQKT